MHILEIFRSHNFLIPKAGRVLENWEWAPVFHEEYGVRHPLGAYTVSLSAVANRTMAVLDLLDDTALFYRRSSTESDWANKILEAMDHLLDALAEHVEDCGGVLRSFFPKSKKRDFEVALEQFKKQTKPYRNHICKIDNFIKHNQGRLRMVIMSNAVGVVPGYFVEGPIPGGGVGPSNIIHGSHNTAFSFNRDIPFHICNVYAVSAFLAQALHAVNSRLVPSGTTKQNPESESHWDKMVARVAKLPQIYFPDEVKKTVPSIKFGGTSVRIEYPAAKEKSKMLLGQVSVSASYSGDGVTRTYHVPYMAPDPGYA